MEEKYPYFGEKIGTSFPGFLNSMDFAAVSHATGNRWRIPSLHILSSVPQDVNLIGKKHLYYGESMSTNFPGSPHTMGFVGFTRERIS